MLATGDAAESGKGTRLAATLAIATSRSYTIWRCCRRLASPSRVSDRKIRAASAGWTRAVAIFED